MTAAARHAPVAVPPGPRTGARAPLPCRHLHRSRTPLRVSVWTRVPRVGPVAAAPRISRCH
eukprot:12681459-Alexandrium_andersonii.AAC.1